MAEFGLPATQLSEPQGRGATPTRAVEEMNIGPNPLVGMVSKVVDIFSDGLANNAKRKAEEYKNGILGSFTRSYNSITEAQETGQITQAEATMRQNAMSRQMSSQFPELRGEFSKTVQDLRGMTQAGNIEAERKAEFDLAVQLKTDAAKAGYPITPGQTKETQQALVRTYQEGVQAKAKLDAHYAAQSERRSLSKEEREVADREFKDKSFTLVSDIAGSNMDSFAALGQDVVRRANMPGADLQALSLELSQNYSRIRIGLDAAARTNPELAGGYKSIFEQMHTLTQGMLKPGSAVEASNAQITLLKNRLKLMALNNDPQFAAAVAVGELIPPSIMLNLSVDKPAAAAIAYLTTATGASYVPRFVGDSKLEKPVLESLKKAISTGPNPLVKDVKKFEAQKDLSVSEMLKQAKNLAQQSDVSPDRLMGVANFLASSEFGEYVSKSGGLDKETLSDVTYLLQQHVIQNVEKQVLNKMRQTVMFGGQEMTISDIVDVKFTGSGLAFVPKNEGGLTLTEQQRYKDLVEGLKTSQNALTTSLHIMTHATGSRDYAATWEKSKSKIFPTLFPEPKETTPKAKPKGGDAAVAVAVGELGTRTMSQAETDEYDAVIQEALKRTDLSERAKKELRESLKGPR